MVEYLEVCKNSEKYKKGQWWVIENLDKAVVSALISYNLGKQVVGVGSICTPLELRQRGYASELLRGYLGSLEPSTEAVYLWSDINPTFYEKFGFKALPKIYQPHSDSMCMVRTMKFEAYLSSVRFKPPKYF